MEGSKGAVPVYSQATVINGLCERHHAAIDLTKKKIMADDSTLTIDEALKHSVWARNVEITRLGDSPQKIMF